MANSASAKKRARQNTTRRTHNAALRSRARTAMKKVEAAIEAGDQKAAKEAFDKAVPIIDSTTRKGMMHENKAARRKSRLNRRIRAMG